MNHKRGRRKSVRAGCLWCKPHKHQAEKKRTRRKSEKDALAHELRGG